ncbi:histidinol-phosphatase HisJ [Lysinibacillus sp. KU-BSD001]|uniref:histidinol-phosphatase HisJ n=1 Tax=Lysinibacillus sp. KU-BSD001 TaxID=3141328 RepID=UPI0036E0CB23
MKKDGHIHTPFCPHGSPDLFEHYIEKAIQHQFTDITFTEHAPLPPAFHDPTPDQDSGMDANHLQRYLSQLNDLKSYYKNKIHINIGLEVDYIRGYEKETTAFLDEIGPQLDDAILSVHFLQYENEYCCIDFSEEVYLQFAEKVGGIQQLYDLYYETVRASITADLGPYKPKRIGHPTLIHKFQHAHQQQIDDDAQVKAIFHLMKESNYELDLNSAGLSKPLCREPYPPYHLIEYAKEINLRYVFGSDAHTVKDLHQHYDIIFKD